MNLKRPFAMVSLWPISHPRPASHHTRPMQAAHMPNARRLQTTHQIIPRRHRGRHRGQTTILMTLKIRKESAAALRDRLKSAKNGRLGSEIMTNSNKPEYCTICRRVLDNPADPLSGNCGGDCWGCIGAIEAKMGCAESLAYVRKEYEAGLRPGWIDPFTP